MAWHESFFPSAHTDMFHYMSFIRHSLRWTVPFLHSAAYCRSLGIPIFSILSSLSPESLKSSNTFSHVSVLDSSHPEVLVFRR